MSTDTSKRPLFAAAHDPKRARTSGEPTAQAAETSSSSQALPSQTSTSASLAPAATWRVFGYVIGIYGDITEIKMRQPSPRVSFDEFATEVRGALPHYVTSPTRRKLPLVPLEFVEIDHEWRIAMDEEGALADQPNMGINTHTGNSLAEPYFYGPVVVFRVTDANAQNDPLGSTVAELDPLPTQAEIEVDPRYTDTDMDTEEVENELISRLLAAFASAFATFRRQILAMAKAIDKAN